MTNENPTPPAAPEPQPLAPSAVQPTPPVYQQPQYAPREQRPPLTRRAKTGAAWAGIVGFNLLTVGFFVFLVPLALLALGGFVQWLVATAIQQGTADVSPDMLRTLENFDPGVWVLPLLIVSAVGLIIWIVALIISRSILRSSGAVKPWAITWAATGISIVVYWIVWTIIGFVSSIVSSFIGILTQSIESQATAAILGTVVSLILTIIVNSIIGWLVWRWMAHAMRPAQQLVTQE